jgi:hypothetical protein
MRDDNVCKESCCALIAGLLRQLELTNKPALNRRLRLIRLTILVIPIFDSPCTSARRINNKAIAPLDSEVLSTTQPIPPMLWCSRCSRDRRLGGGTKGGGIDGFRHRPGPDNKEHSLTSYQNIISLALSTDCGSAPVLPLHEFFLCHNAQSSLQCS